MSLAWLLPLVLLMKVAIPIWTGRVSPVFDVAKNLIIAEIDQGRELGRTQEPLKEAGLAARAGRVAELGIDMLICGAISQPLEGMLFAKGVRVIPWICGSVEDVLRAFVSGEPAASLFLMPGCRGGRGRGRRGRGRGRRGRGWDS